MIIYITKWMHSQSKYFSEQKKFHFWFSVGGFCRDASLSGGPHRPFFTTSACEWHKLNPFLILHEEVYNIEMCLSGNICWYNNHQSAGTAEYKDIIFNLENWTNNLKIKTLTEFN